MSLEGGCICGGLRYRIEEEAPPFVVCFCTDCQRRFGSGLGIHMPVWKSRFFVEGDCLVGRRPVASGAEATAFSCPHCLTETHSCSNRLPDLMLVRPMTLDDFDAAKPAAFLWTRSKPRWIALPEGGRAYDRQPDDPAVWMDIFEFGRRPQ